MNESDDVAEGGVAEGGEAVGGDQVMLVMDDHGCIACGYNLKGLQTSGVCPECGSPVWKSIRGDLFEHASFEYVSKLHRGAQTVVGGVLLYVIVMIVSIVLGGLTMSTNIGIGTVSAVQFVAQILGIGASITIAVGWWWLSEPNPASLNPSAGSTSRQFVRVAAAISVVFTVGRSALGLVIRSGATPMTLGGTQMGLLSVAVLLSLAGLVVFAVSYFSQMAYLKWMSPRIPNDWVFKRAKLMMWLGPVLFVPGSICIGLGPLVALILYYNLVTRVRADLKAILGTMSVSA